MGEKQLAKQEEDELKMALQLSLQEAENKNALTTNFPDVPKSVLFDEQKQVEEKQPAFQYPDLDSLEISPPVDEISPGSNVVKEETEVSLPLGEWCLKNEDIMTNVVKPDAKVSYKILDAGLEDFLTPENETFVRNFSKSIDILNLRLQTCRARGKDILQDATAQHTFATISSQHNKLLEILADLDGQRQHFEKFQDDLRQVKETREAIDTMQEEIKREEERRRLEEEERRKEIMKAKLDALRASKEQWMKQQGYGNQSMPMSNGYAPVVTQNNGYQQVQEPVRFQYPPHHEPQHGYNYPPPQTQQPPQQPQFNNQYNQQPNVHYPQYQAQQHYPQNTYHPPPDQFPTENQANPSTGP